MRKLREKLYQWIFTILAFSSLVFLTASSSRSFKEALPVFSQTASRAHLRQCLVPTAEPPESACSPLSRIVRRDTGRPDGLRSHRHRHRALFHELATASQRAVLKPLIEILAGIRPSSSGFFGMVIVAPFLQTALDIPVGLCAFSASLVLGIMATPTVASLAEDALSFVPRSFREASLALGAKPVADADKSHHACRRLGHLHCRDPGNEQGWGETMTVLMVAGGAAACRSRSSTR